MAGQANGTRKDRLAAALKENLKRRKAQSRAKAKGERPDGLQELGTAREAGLDDEPEPPLKNVPNRT